MTVKIIKLEKNDCPKCDAMRPMFGSILSDIKEEGVEVETINTDVTPEAIGQYHISGVPVMVFTKDGVEKTRLVGLAKPAEIFSAIEFTKEAR